MPQTPKHRDLGDLDAPVLVFGGPYSNLQATRALIAEARARGIGQDRIICTGDTVAYCAEARGTVAALRDLGCAVVAGNCERQLAAGAPDCGCGFDEGSECDLLAAGWYAHADRTVTSQDRAWMAACPDVVTFTQAGRRCAVIHGGQSDIARFLWPVSPGDAFAGEIALIGAAVGAVDIVLAGHCGIAFQRQIGAVTWINAGAIGLPPHDGRPETRFAVLEAGRAVIHRLAYDHSGAQAAMRAAGLGQGYHDTLATGIWPSEDVLPPEMRRGRSAADGRQRGRDSG